MKERSKNRWPRLALLFALLLLWSACAHRERRPTAQTPVSNSGSQNSSGRKCGLICKIKEKRKSQPADPPAKAPPGPESSKNSSSPPSSSPATDKPKEPKPASDIKKEEKKKKEPPPKTETKPPATESKKSTEPNRGKGVYHTVKKGETFWRICRTYGVDMNEVARVNGITDPTAIQVGQKIWIPGAERVLEVPPAPVTNPPPEKNKSNDKAGDPSPSPASTRGLLLFPVPGGKITSRFGPRNGHMHEGIDIVAPLGSDILAAEDGKVVYSDNRMSGYGNMIIIKHAGNLYTVYAHNLRNLVQVGDMVKRGQKIAEVGQTGRASAPHCHFEVRVGDKPVNPELYLP